MTGPDYGPDYDPYLDPAVYAGEPPAPAGPVVFEFADVGDFFDRLVAPVYTRKLTPSRLWCGDWFLHPEAVARLEGVWRIYEVIRLPPPLDPGPDDPPPLPGQGEQTGISVWQRDFLDYHMGVLMDERGPFQMCRAGKHVDLLPLPNNPRPPHLFG